MTRWPITRSWLVVDSDAESRKNTIDLLEYRACCMLGSAGLGKTYELRFLSEREQGGDVRFLRLATLATSAEGLESRLDTLAASLTERSAIYLDALDEAMVPVRTAGLIAWAWPSLQRNRLRLRCCSRFSSPEGACQPAENNDSRMAWHCLQESVRNAASWGRR
jgi:hypothetical protein